MMLSALSSVYAFNWQPGANNVQWATGCDFYGGDLYPVASTGENCGGNCANVAQCTHFTYFQGTCYLKHFNNAASAKDLNGAIVFPLRTKLKKGFVFCLCLRFYVGAIVFLFLHVFKYNLVSLSVFV